MEAVTGLHHVTVIAGDPNANVRFYSTALGLRLVKRTVNQDVPDTYHLFYADGAGSPGTDLTFFPWPGMGPGRPGVGLAMEVALAIPIGSGDFWRARLASGGVAVADETRFGERAILFQDPDHLQLALVEAPERAFVVWDRGPVPAAHQVRGLHGVRLWERDAGRTETFLKDGLGLRAAGIEGDWHRYAAGSGGSGTHLDVRQLPEQPRGTWGRGSVHHVAWRVPTADAQVAIRERVASAGARPTEVIDRFWFRSIYFKEPGGALFEIATDGPGFSVDEPADHLGETLILPPWLEPQRAAIEGALPPLLD